MTRPAVTLPFAWLAGHVGLPAIAGPQMTQTHSSRMR
jgi:hypothetical protein